MGGILRGKLLYLRAKWVADDDGDAMALYVGDVEWKEYSFIINACMRML